MADFNFFNKRNFVLALAAILVVAMGFMAMNTYKKPAQKEITYEEEIMQMESQSDSDSMESIEKDLTDTDLDNLDKELQDIEIELDTAN